MTTEINPTPLEKHKTRVIHDRGASGAVYGLGLIGAWVYFIGHATTIWLGVLGFFKGIVWPALMVFELLKYLNM
jgi:hypothetical protein